MATGDCVYEYNGSRWEKFDGCGAEDKDCEGGQPSPNQFHELNNREPRPGDTMLHACEESASPGFRATGYRLPPSARDSLMIVIRDGDQLHTYVTDTSDADAMDCRRKILGEEDADEDENGIYHQPLLNHMDSHGCFFCAITSAEFANGSRSGDFDPGNIELAIAAPPTERDPA